MEKLSVLSKDQQDMLQEQIKLRYFMPVITKVLDIKMSMAMHIGM